MHPETGSPKGSGVPVEREVPMGRSRHLNVDCARSQEAYFAKIRAAVHALAQGEGDAACPRDGCAHTVSATEYGRTMTLRCPGCGIIYRGSRDRLLEYYD
jgi:hypothetical protein